MTETGESVYCQRPIVEREYNPLYQAARELVKKYANGKMVLDLGCSDFVACRSLIKEGHRVIGIDLNEKSLQQARGNTDNLADVVCADLTKLPLKSSDDVGVVLLLDVLEHLNRDEAVVLLKELRDQFNEARIIVSMPIISSKTLPTYLEKARAIVKGGPLLTGLFDRTHQILTDQNGHRRVFYESGLEIREEYVVDFSGRVSGEWRAVDSKKRRRGFKAIIIKSIDMVSNVVGGSKTGLLAYQGLYVLEPKQ